MISSKKIIIESTGDEEDAEKRRIDNEWSLGPNCPEVGLQAHALYEFLISSGEVDEDDFDVYNLIPEGDEYGMRIFGIINSDIDGWRYLVGDNEDTEYAAYKSTEDLFDDVGIDHFKHSDLEDHLDMDEIISYFEDVISDDAWNYPEGYLQDSDKMLSTEQENIIELKELKVQKLKSFIESIEEKNTDKSRIKNKVEELNDIIDDLRLEILSIKEDPQGDYPDHLIQQSIEDRMEDIKSNPLDYAEDWGLNLKDYVDMESLAKYVVDTDGYGVALAKYDSEENEEYILGKLYYIFRID
jgi:hypothetical protein